MGCAAAVSRRALPRPRPRRVCSRRGPDTRAAEADPTPPRRIAARMTGCACERIHIRPLSVLVRQLGQETPERAPGVAGVLLERHDALQVGAPLRLNVQRAHGSSVGVRSEGALLECVSSSPRHQVDPSQAAGLPSCGATKRPLSQSAQTVSSSNRVLHCQRTVASTMSRTGAPHFG